MTITTTPYGTYTHGVPRQIGHGQWSRLDIWRSSLHKEEPIGNRHWCDGAHDDSAAYVGYDATCSWCWLGYGHTTQEHAKRVAAQKGT